MWTGLAVGDGVGVEIKFLGASTDVGEVPGGGGVLGADTCLAGVVWAYGTFLVCAGVEEDVDVSDSSGNFICWGICFPENFYFQCGGIV